MENGQGTGGKLGLPPLTPEQQEALQKVTEALFNFVCIEIETKMIRKENGSNCADWTFVLVVKSF